MKLLANSLRQLQIYFAAIAVIHGTSTTLLAEPIDFNRDVRPILAKNCFACHGRDANARKADLRLDIREAAIGSAAFVPTKPADSELISRITTP